MPELGLFSAPSKPLFNPRRLKAARERCGKTARELAAEIGKAPTAISQYEDGSRIPTDEVQLLLSAVLRVSDRYFYLSDDPSSLEADSCHFRAKQSVSVRDRRAVVQLANDLVRLVRSFEKTGVQLPVEQVTSFPSPHLSFLSDGSGTLSSQQIEAIENTASRLRLYWQLGLGPIANLVSTLESRGVLMLKIPHSYQDVDAFATWAGARPCILMSMNKQGARARFDAAHELGHLILHELSDPSSAYFERQANRFAGAFLMPRETFISQSPRKYNLEVLLSLKRRWRVSIQAILRRAHDLGTMSYSSYQRAMKQIGEQGLRTNEPEDFEIETPSLMRQSVEVMLQENALYLDEMPERMGLDPQEALAMICTNIPAELAKRIPATRKQTLPQVGFIKIGSLERGAIA